MKKAIVYINQFFGQIGGEDKADYPTHFENGVVGAAMGIQNVLEGEVTHTIVCGDNYIGENTDKVVEEILKFLSDKEFDIFFAGPAFQAGRYGVACGTVCKAVKEKFNVPVVTSMHVENPGVEMFKQYVPIFSGANSAAGMRKDVPKMVAFGNKILKGEALLSAEEEGYFPRGVRHQYWLEDEKPAADRAVEMLIKKVRGEAFQTELPIPKPNRVPIAPPISDLSQATVALVTSGGIVPVGNPDKIQSASATRWGKYDFAGLDALPNRETNGFMTTHAGYDPAAADSDPNRVVPVDALRAYEKEGKIGKLYESFYTTVGTGTTQGEAARMAKEMVADMEGKGITAVILTST